MSFDFRSLRSAALISLVLLVAGCGNDAGDESEVPEVAGEVPEVAGSGGGGGGEVEAGLRELSRYQLTMANVRKFVAAQENYNKFKTQHPEAAKDEEEEEEDDDDDRDSSGQLSLDQMVTSLERNPNARRIIQDAGMNVREFALTSLTLFAALGGQMLVQQGANSDSLARVMSVHPANFRFVKQNEAELRTVKQLVGLP